MNPPPEGPARALSLIDSLAPNLSGLETLRALIAAGGSFPIGETLGIRLVEVEEGRVVFTGTPGANAYNPIGSVHGGYAATILDSACGCAVHSKLSPSQMYTTLELKVAYLKGITDRTGMLRAEGRIQQIGRRAAFSEAELRDSNGRLYATATSTLLVMER